MDLGLRDVSSQILVAIGSMAGPGLGGRMARFSRDNGSILFRSGVRDMEDNINVSFIFSCEAQLNKCTCVSVHPSVVKTEFSELMTTYDSI